VVEANILASKSKINFGVFNVAGGKDTSIIELARLLNNILGKDIRPEFLRNAGRCIQDAGGYISGGQGHQVQAFGYFWRGTKLDCRLLEKKCVRKLY
jgi:nucleoside-diphosphate-sugar epimerase